MLNKTSGKLRVEVVYAFRHDPLVDDFERATLARPWGGGVVLRLQARELMVPHLPPNIELTFSGLCFDLLPVQDGSGFSLRTHYFNSWLKTRQPAVFIVVRNLAVELSPEELAQIKERAIAVGVDFKDTDLSQCDLSQYDFHISASETGRRAMEAILAADSAPGGRRPFVATWYQSYDQRLAELKFRKLDRLAAVYLGHLDHAAIPPALADEITAFSVIRPIEMKRAMRSLRKFNFHYAVRPDPLPELRRRYKPFTKGVTAAACRSNILVDRQVDDAIEFLTPDYPYLVESNAPGPVEEGFRKALQEFGGPEWRRGLEIMRSVAERVSGPAQARQFADIVIRAADR